MQTGTKISAAAHLLLLGIAVFGGAFRSEPLPFEVQNVSVVTAEEFAAMTAPRQAPDVASQPAALIQPEADNASPEVKVQPDEAPERDTPEATAQPEAETEPEALAALPVPEATADDSVPVLPQPEPEVTVLPESAVPNTQSRPADRVAPQPVAPPPPDATPDPVETPQVTPDEGGETERDVQDATAPEEATDRIVTEADQSDSLAPTSAPRPPSRPKTRPVAQSAPEKDTRTDVDAALAEALGGAAPAAANLPPGPPMTAGEKEALRVAVSACWNVGSLSSAALQTTVVVGVTMTRDGKPETASIRMLSSSGGSEASARQAFEAARRAIIRCGARGYDLPAEKYSRWRDIEMTFNPERMRIK